ncbi:MAG: alcohol dehydrogenase catalytic domain-containing protein [Planctomycetota bacterium]
MKAVVLTGLEQMELRDVPEPKIEKDTDVLLKIERIGVCGSDVHYYETGRIGSQVVEYPYVTGHECAATVKAVGKSVTRVRVGDAIAVDPAVSCYQCFQCKLGRENTCYNLRFLGTPGQGGGCLCEYLVMPQEACYPTNGTITLEQAVLCEPLSIAVYSVQRARLPERANIAILGAGPIGLCTFVSAKAENVSTCYMSEKIPERIEVARRAGATWVGNPDKQDIVKEILKQQPDGLDVAFECAGQQETVDQCVDLLRPGGTLVLTGIPRFDRTSFAIDQLRRKEITIVNIRRQNQCTQKAIDLMASGKINADFMITHHFPLEETQKAFDMVAGYRDGVVKAMIHL